MTRIITEKAIQYSLSIIGGLLLAIESTVPFFLPCFLVTILDIVSAYCLSRRVHRKYPDKSDGKFKSEYKYRILFTMFFAFLLLIVANYVDVYVIKESDLAVRWVVGTFIFYQLWSVFENWSSENDNKLARTLQKVMVNKMERHLNISLDDILDNKQEKEVKDETE